MGARPYFSKSTAEIETLFKQNLNNVNVLQQLVCELSHREKPRAAELREEIASALDSQEVPKRKNTPEGIRSELSKKLPEKEVTVDTPSAAPSERTSSLASSQVQLTFETIQAPPKQDLDGNRAKVINVIQYLAALARVNSVVVTDLEKYQSVLWLSEIPRHATHCYARIWGAEESVPDDVWIEIKKMPEPSLAPVPKNCEPWASELNLRTPDTSPVLPQSITVMITVVDPETGELYEEAQQKSLSENPLVASAWNAYLQQKWQPWSLAYKKYIEIQKVFGALYSTYQDQQRLGEQFELVMSLGLLTWQQPNGQVVRRHLLVAKASLEFEAAIGRFVVKPAPDGDQAEVEFEMLEQECFPTNAHSLVMAGRGLRDNFWDRTLSDSVLASISNSLEGQGRGQYDPAVDSPSGAKASEIPLIEFAPALILRKRSQKGLLNILADMLKQVENGLEIPVQFLELCEAVDLAEQAVEQDDPGESRVLLPDHIYFPLPANDQQRQIIHKLNKQRGVLVQGPPGTGKSQTISNLICHLLATGQRVLVTSKSPRALEVLHDKIPQTVSPLCISMLGSGTEERESLDRSVSGILTKLNNKNDFETARKLEELEQKLSRGRKEKAQAEYALIALREKETFQHSIADGAYLGTAAAIATKLLEDGPRYEWLEDAIGEIDRMPLSASEIDELCVLLQEVPREAEAELKQYVPDVARDIPDCECLRSIWRELAGFEETIKYSEESLKTLSGQAISRASCELVTALLDLLVRLVAEIHSVKRRPLPWIGAAVRDVLADLDTPWKQLCKLSTDRLDQVKALAEQTQAFTVEMPAGIDLVRLSGDAQCLHDHFAAGGKLKQFGIFEHPTIKKHGENVRQVRLNGQICLEKSLLLKLLDYIKVKKLLADIWSLWLGKAVCESEKHPLMQIAEIDEQLEALHHVIELYETRAEVITAVAAIPGLSRPSFENEDSLEDLSQICRTVLVQANMRQVTQKLLSEEARVSGVAARANAHPLCSDLLKAFKERDSDRYCEIMDRLSLKSAMCQRVLLKQTLLKNLGSRAPLFASTIHDENDVQLAVQHLKELANAWAWCQASSWLSAFLSCDDQMLERNVKRLEAASAKALEELAAEKAWSHCFSRMTRAHQQHLVSWSQSMRRLGKGTGKHAHKHRLDAQRSLNQCKGAVPAWVMPLHRVYETVEASPGAFDVIIVDEASQCGFEALPLLYLGKKIIVVGDDKQISPEAVGIDRAHVFNLRDTHLKGFHHAASFDIENSLFGHGQIRFGSRITLREHFRCVPEIIRFSNDLCYRNNPLIPLKQVPPNRLEPLKAMHVSSGYREGSGQATVNRPEAEMLVQQVLECCKDRRYDGMTMGVIVLQGDAQAKIIEDMLVRRLGTEEMQERRLLCGNPYSFQGDERDVVFLSMVAATNERIGALVQEKDMRRFNVAASRAREQMWLFHSVTSNDLSASCFRRKLLHHFYETTKHSVAGILVDELQRMAHVANRWREKAPEPFDSWFEVDVALRIAGRGYTVIPQYEFAGKRIDLVIQGGSAQLAVECDGDHWHGRDQFEADMQRQRMLERCNWVFFRVREANYIIDAEKALGPLWGMLESKGIFPNNSQNQNEAPDEPNFGAGLGESAESFEEEYDDKDAGDTDGEGDDADDEEAGAEELAAEPAEPLEGCPLTINAALNLRPADLRKLILEAMRVLPNCSCVRGALPTIILKRCRIRTKGAPRKLFERKVENQVAAMIRDGHLVAYKSKNDRLKLGCWVDVRSCFRQFTDILEAEA